MVYLADNWPTKYRQMVGMCNVHGQRLNFDKLEQQGSGYVGRRGEDLFFADDPWFRGISLKYGPDGGVFVSDWCDLGECHDNDGVHNTSGRIYKVTYQRPRKLEGQLDMFTQSSAQLVDAQLAMNDWYVRHARRILQERAAGGDDMTGVHQSLKKMFADAEAVRHKLRALWALYATGGTDDALLRELLQHDKAHVRRWAVRLLTDSGIPDDDTQKRFAEMAQSDDSPIVRLAVASALQRLPVDARWPIATGLASHEGDNEDHNLPLMIWYGIEPAVAAHKAQALKLAAGCKLSKVRQFIAKRVAEGSGK
jgi:hypothetical protein